MVNREGQIYFASSQAQRWLQDYFARNLPANRLPAPVARWLALTLRSRRPRPPLVATKRAARLTVRLLFPEPDGTLCLLLTEESRLTSNGAGSGQGSLTSRQAEVLFWVRTGKSDKEIAEALGLSVATVSKHLQHVFEKLGVNNRTAAVTIAPVS